MRWIESPLHDKVCPVRAGVILLNTILYILSYTVCPVRAGVIPNMTSCIPSHSCLSRASGSYSQITELRAEKEQFVPARGSYSIREDLMALFHLFVPRAGELFCRSRIYSDLWRRLSRTSGSYSKGDPGEPGATGFVPCERELFFIVITSSTAL